MYQVANIQKTMHKPIPPPATYRHFCFANDLSQSIIEMAHNMVRFNPEQEKCFQDTVEHVPHRINDRIWGVNSFNYMLSLNFNENGNRPI